MLVCTASRSNERSDFVGPLFGVSTTGIICVRVEIQKRVSNKKKSRLISDPTRASTYKSTLNMYVHMYV